MKHPFFLLCLFALLQQSCKKTDDGDSNPPPTSSGKKLAKQVETDGSYTNTTLFTYDADGKLFRMRQTETGGGSTYEEGLRIIRKTGGIIDKVNFLTSSHTDSITLTVASTGQQYSSTEWSESVGSSTVTHKTTFTYNTEGHIVEAIEVDSYGSTVDPKRRITFTYVNNNLTSVKVYRTSTGTNILFYQYDLEYDSKSNPMALGAEWIVLSSTFNDFYPQSSTNNFTKLTLRETGQPDEVYNVTYTYSSQNLPVSASMKSSDPSQPAVTTAYTYE